MKTPRWLITAAAVAVLALGVAACGDDDAAETTTTAAVTTTAGAATTTTAGAPTTTAAGATTTTAGSGSTDPIEITVIAKDIAFNVAEITVAAGQEVTLILDNQDLSADEGHNIHVRTTTNDYFTAIHTAPDTSEVVFTINEPGTYEFFCDT
ncbi:MAG TPA: cupredoxin domain-containing protein, partial [Acidimicrobiia bacterium]|nr:cupredoxin domain-containing protein [Acidimicrobiia bacterium]